MSDANLVLGRIPPALLNGEVPLVPGVAENAIRKHVAERLGMDLVAAAQGIVDLVNANMTGGLKVMSVERGLDPRDFALAAFGGASPVHGAELMREPNAARPLVPRFPTTLARRAAMQRPAKMFHRGRFYDADEDRPDAPSQAVHCTSALRSGSLRST